MSRWSARALEMQQDLVGLDREACYRAVLARDARFDGRFFTAVLSTGIFCRPICPARPPRLEHCVFFPTAAAAHAAGFRPCLRCRPEIAPGLPAWNGTATTVSRALRLIADGGPTDLEALASRLGVGSRHLRRLFQRHVGASPVAVRQAQRLLLAKQLITDSRLPLADVALAAGFGSVRRFNAVIRATYGRPARDLRRAVGPGSPGLTLRLPFRPPYDWAGVLEFLVPRAIPGVEAVEDSVYRRSVSVDGARGFVEVRAASGPFLLATIAVDRLPALAAVVARLRHVFDLDADPAAIAAHLARDPLLAPRVAGRPGLRVPGAWDAFELAVRAILGQQVSVAAATTLAGRLVAAHGTPLGVPAPAGVRSLFPSPAALADADLGPIGLPRARAAAIRALAAALVRDPALLDAAGDLDATVRRLATLPGIGPWTAEYIAMRALREPDAFPATDLGLLRALGATGSLASRAERWRPWRAYAAMHLWLGETLAPPAAAATPARVKRGSARRAAPVPA